MTPTNYRSNTSDPFGSKAPSTRELAEQMLSQQTLPKNAIIPESSGEVLNGLGVRLDALGFHVTRQMTDDEMFTVGKVLSGLYRSAQLWAGDWTIEQMRRHPHLTVEDIANQFDYEPRTLERIVFVCNNTPMMLRGANLDYTHYKIVAHLDDKELQRDLLVQADAEAWTTRDLRDALADHIRPTPPDEEAFNLAIDEVKRAVLRITSSGVGEDQRRIFAEHLVRTAKTIYPNVHLG